MGFGLFVSCFFPGSLHLHGNNIGSLHLSCCAGSSLASAPPWQHCVVFVRAPRMIESRVFSVWKSRSSPLVLKRGITIFVGRHQNQKRKPCLRMSPATRNLEEMRQGDAQNFGSQYFGVLFPLAFIITANLFLLFLSTPPRCCNPRSL